jgi:hypothetical protein
MYMVSLVVSRLVISIQCYARTAFILLYIGMHQRIVYTDNILPRSASANSPSIKLSNAEQYVA